MPNRLAAESSPYLLQHKENPIDWFPWGEEALALAKKADRPIFLSVGYSSCHWCHVMAHESFEDEAVARALNRDFVSIKLDREERPDVDEIYMTAVQLATGHGGWPMSVFLTPDLKPFFAGTYFPREGRGGFPGFLSIVTGLAQAWREQRKEVEAQATEFAQGLGRVLERGAPAASSGLSMELIDSVIEALHADFDHEHGGFGGHPKFPPHSAIAFLLDYLETRPSLPSAVEATLQMAEEMARDTLLALCLGGIRDHVAGGFHRYSTDEKWLLPHFEKMLYDNAQMLASLARGARRWPGSGMLAQAAEETADWLECDLMSPDGLFFSALDADSEGEEGKFYVWSQEEVERVLGEKAAAFCPAYGIQPEGNFLDEATHRATGLNVIHLRTPETGFTEEMALLRAARSGRVAPGLDDKAIAAWNGLAISAMSLCVRIDAAARCAEAWLARSREGLPHQIVRGVASGRGFLDDYACLADGLLDLHEATGEGRWRVEAERLAEEMIERFSDPAGGGLFYSEQGHGTPIGRTKPVMDSATPGANSVTARVLRRLGRTPEALNLLNANLGWIERMPTATESMSRVALALLAAGESGPARTRSESRVEVTLEPRALTTGPDGWAHGLVMITVPAGSHINTDDPPAKWLHPTELHVDGILGEAAFPASDDDRYEGIIEIRIRLRPTRRNQEFELRVSFQVCTETECLSPEVQTLSGVVAGPEPG